MRAPPAHRHHHDTLRLHTQACSACMLAAQSHHKTVPPKVMQACGGNHSHSIGACCAGCGQSGPNHPWGPDRPLGCLSQHTSRPQGRVPWCHWCGGWCSRLCDGLDQVVCELRDDVDRGARGVVVLHAARGHSFIHSFFRKGLAAEQRHRVSLHRSLDEELPDAFDPCGALVEEQGHRVQLQVACSSHLHADTLFYCCCCVRECVFVSHLVQQSRCFIEMQVLLRRGLPCLAQPTLVRARRLR